MFELSDGFVCLFAVSVLSFSDSFYDDFGEKITSVKHASKTTFRTIPTSLLRLPLKDVLRLSLNAVQYKRLTASSIGSNPSCLQAHLGVVQVQFQTTAAKQISL